jgi:hypothetical protein
LGLISTRKFSFSTLDSLLKPHFALIMSEIEYASIAWNSVTITDSNKLDHILRKFKALSHNDFFQDVEYCYDNLLEELNLLTLHMRHRHSDTSMCNKCLLWR